MTNRISISKTFDWYLTEIMPVVEKYAIQQKGGYHGLYTHTAAVVFRGIDYALTLGHGNADIIQNSLQVNAHNMLHRTRWRNI